MALTIDGIAVSQSTGATTFARNRYGSYTRRRTKPVNPNSPKQEASRAAFRAAVLAWTQDLTPTQRGTWQNYSVTLPWLNRIGQSVELQAQDLFIRYYASWIREVNVAPANLNAPVIDTLGDINVTADGSGAILEDGDLTAGFNATQVLNSAQAVGGRWVVQMTPGQNPSRRYPGSRWSSITSIAGAASPSLVVDFPNNGTQLPWVYQAGQIVWFRFRGLAPIATDRRVTEQVIVGPVSVIDAE